MSMATSKLPTIECSANGPYIVRGLETLSNSKGKQLPVKEVIELCRCGGSANKPFCDGTHKKNGFIDEKLANRTPDRRNDYVGKRITIHDNRGICAHAGACTAGLSQVWRSKKEPWIDADAADVQAVVDTIKQCPSGALSYTIDNIEHRDQARDPAILVSKNGPYRVSGAAELKNTPWGQGASREHYTLCRCGASKNKPFCDGTHRHIKFRDDKN
jgi:CDGSH-type Zn-finger protein